MSNTPPLKTSKKGRDVSAQEENQKNKPLEGGVQMPHNHDVICGRGGGSNNHIGNIFWRQLVKGSKELYITVPKRQKMHVAQSIVSAVRDQNPPGRFLEKDEGTSLWYEIEDKRAQDKTSQALRESAPLIRRDMFQSDASKQRIMKAAAWVRNVTMRRVHQQNSKSSTSETAVGHHQNNMIPPPGEGPAGGWSMAVPGTMGTLPLSQIPPAMMHQAMFSSQTSCSGTTPSLPPMPFTVAPPAVGQSIPMPIYHPFPMMLPMQMPTVHHTGGRQSLMMGGIPTEDLMPHTSPTSEESDLLTSASFPLDVRLVGVDDTREEGLNFLTKDHSKQDEERGKHVVRCSIKVDDQMEVVGKGVEENSHPVHVSSSSSSSSSGKAVKRCLTKSHGDHHFSSHNSPSSASTSGHKHPSSSEVKVPFLSQSLTDVSQRSRAEREEEFVVGDGAHLALTMLSRSVTDDTPVKRKDIVEDEKKTSSNTENALQKRGNIEEKKVLAKKGLIEKHNLSLISPSEAAVVTFNSNEKKAVREKDKSVSDPSSSHPGTSSSKRRRSSFSFQSGTRRKAIQKSSFLQSDDIPPPPPFSEKRQVSINGVPGILTHQRTRDDEASSCGVGINDICAAPPPPSFLRKVSGSRSLSGEEVPPLSSLMRAVSGENTISDKKLNDSSKCTHLRNGTAVTNEGKSVAHLRPRHNNNGSLVSPIRDAATDGSLCCKKIISKNSMQQGKESNDTQSSTSLNNTTSSFKRPPPGKTSSWVSRGTQETDLAGLVCKEGGKNSEVKNDTPNGPLGCNSKNSCCTLQLSSSSSCGHHSVDHEKQALEKTDEAQPKCGSKKRSAVSELVSTLKAEISLHRKNIVALESKLASLYEISDCPHDNDDNNLKNSNEEGPLSCENTGPSVLHKGKQQGPVKKRLRDASSVSSSNPEEEKTPNSRLQRKSETQITKVPKKHASDSPSCAVADPEPDIVQSTLVNSEGKGGVEHSSGLLQKGEHSIPSHSSSIKKQIGPCASARHHPHQMGPVSEFNMNAYVGWLSQQSAGLASDNETFENYDDSNAVRLALLNAAKMESQPSNNQGDVVRSSTDQAAEDKSAEPSKESKN